MASNTDSRVQFPSSDTRNDEMHSTIEQWAENVTEEVDDARASEQFQAWLDVQSRFHDYSYRNTLLIARQCPEATKVAGYRTWQEEFNRQVQDGESAIWIWAPIIAKQCPGCGNSPDYHADTDCDYDDTPPEEWSEGPVAFRPVPVFDISQTEGEPLPELDTEARGDATELFPAVFGAAGALDVQATIIDAAEWTHGSADGICRPTDEEETETIAEIQVKDRENTAAVTATLIHEYAHALLHSGVADKPEREKREVEAEAVAYIVGRYFGLDMGGSAMYLAAWQSDDTDTILDRLDWISRTATAVIETVEDSMRE